MKQICWLPQELKSITELELTIEIPGGEWWQKRIIKIDQKLYLQMLIGLNSSRTEFLLLNFTSKFYKLLKTIFRQKSLYQDWLALLVWMAPELISLACGCRFLYHHQSPQLISKFLLNQAINKSLTEKVCLLLYSLLPGKKAEGLSSHLITISMTHATGEKH